MDQNYTGKSIKKMKEVLLIEMRNIIHECVQKSIIRNPKNVSIQANDLLCIADSKDQH